MCRVQNSCAVCGKPAGRRGKLQNGKRRVVCSDECEREAMRWTAIARMKDAGYTPMWKREEVIRALRRDARRLKRPPTQTEWGKKQGEGISPLPFLGLQGTKFPHPSPLTVRKLFGSWNAALEAAELETIPQGGPGRLRSVRFPGKCQSGKHSWIPENISVLHDGTQRCRLCRNDRARELRERQRKRRRARKPRLARGEKHYFAKLSNKQVREIRKRVQAGEVQRALALEFGVSPMTISNIVNRKVWKHV